MSVEKQKEKQEEIRRALTKLKHPETYVPVIMPECADLYLSQINGDYFRQIEDTPTSFDLFKEYFHRFRNSGDGFDDGIHHRFYWGLKNTRNELEQFFMNNCETLPSGDYFGDTKEYPREHRDHPDWYPYGDNNSPEVGSLSCCIPCSCLHLWGDRRIKQIGAGTNEEDKLPDENYRLNRLFLGDVIWLFNFERMGIFKIVGGILDDFANGGKYPIPNNNITSLILEMMVRDVKKGTGSTIKDRAYTYAKCLGWKLTTQPTEINPDKVTINYAFNKLFHKFINLSLYYFKEKRLAEAIAQTSVVQPSAATKIAIQDTISLLKNAMEAFHQGRNYYNTLNGIVWVIAGIDLIYQIRDSFGIPLSYNTLEQIIPAAYSLIVEKKTINTSDTNRFKLHYECGQDARDILIDISGNAIHFNNPEELGIWLNLVESRVEGYRIAYLEMTGVDLGKEGERNIEQQI